MASTHEGLGIPGLEDAQEIARGGFATVYRAHQPVFRRDVAVKVLHAHHLTDEGRRRFRRECEAMGSLSAHPAITTVLDAGFTDQGRPYLVMEYRPKGSLADRLATDRALSWDEASAIAIQIAGALESAHGAGVLHRDVKPANILISGFGDAELTDFGIAVVGGAHDTRSGELLASLVHAAPELLDGARPSPSSDVYSLGSTLFELLSGRPAFVPGDEEMAVSTIRRVADDPVPDLRPFGVPDAVCSVIEAAMAKEPSERPGGAAAFAAECNEAREESGRAQIPVRISAAETTATDATRHVAVAEMHARSVIGEDAVASRRASVRTPRRRVRRFAAVAIAAVALAAAALGVVQVTQSNRDTTVEAVASEDAAPADPTEVAGDTDTTGSDETATDDAATDAAAAAGADDTTPAQDAGGGGGGGGGGNGGGANNGRGGGGGNNGGGGGPPPPPAPA